MSTGYQVYNQYSVYYLTFTIVDWVDLFTRKIYKDIMIDSLQYCIDHKMLKVYSYVIMSNHVHLILQAGGEIPLSDIIRDAKKFTARLFLETIATEPESRREWLLHRFKFNATIKPKGNSHQVWIHGNHAIEINTLAFFEQKQNYIHQNPVRAGYVDFPEDFVYSSAYELANRGNKLPITLWH